MSIGSNIKKIRESKNISQESISKNLKVFLKYYQNVEGGLKIPNDDMLRKIAAFLGVSTNEIINFDERKYKIEKNRLDLKNLKYIEQLSDQALSDFTIIGNVTYIPIKRPNIREFIQQKPQLLNREDIFLYGNNINLVGVNGILPNSTIEDIENPIEGLIVNNNKPSSPRILNFVEPYKYRGKFKTLFYTEVNTGLKEGDRVFILNGNYDSNKLIKLNKYKRKRDGYQVLFVDKCKIVLDIDYNGVLPYNDVKTDDFINLYIVNNKSDYSYFSKQITTSGSSFDYKFNKGKNNFIYSNTSYPLISDWGENLGIPGDGFFVKNGTQSWIDITPNFIVGSFSVVHNPLYLVNYEVKIHNGSFTYSFGNEVVEFKEGYIYKWDNTLDNPKWVINTSYIQPYITKTNFRGGNFKGEWNSGIFGNHEEKIEWEGSPATWNSGTLLHSKWNSGIMRSLYSLPESYLSDFENGKPYEKLNAPNNNGWGYNYIIDSDIDNITIENGNIINSILGKNLTFSVIEDYILDTESNFQFNIKANIKESRLLSGYIKESDVVNSESINSKLENVRSINSGFKNSLIKDSKYLSEDNIKILAYDELTLKLTNNSILKPSHKVYRFYISERDYKKLKIRDRFYIKGLVLNDNTKYPLHFFNKRFRFSTWTEYIDFYSGDLNIGEYFFKRGIDMAAFISTPKDNEWLYNTYVDNANSTATTTLVKEIDSSLSEYYSIDIFVSLFDNDSIPVAQSANSIPSEISSFGLLLNNDISTSTPNNIILTNKIRDIIDISKAFIVNSDFESGLIEKTDWISGDHVNYNNDVNITSNTEIGGTYSIIANTSSSTLALTTNVKWVSDKFEISDDCLSQNNIVYLNNVTYTSLNGEQFQLGDAYKILDNNFRSTGILNLKEIGTNIIQSLPDTTGTFSAPDSNSRYGYLHTSKIDYSKIKSGIFRRAYITNSLIENEDYNSSDRTFNNLPLIKSLVISDSIFRNNGNILSKATYLHTSFVNGSDRFLDGIVFKSLWNGMTFSNGVFKESSWFNGTFISGNFYNNRSFNSLPNSNYPYYDIDRIKNYYKDGITSGIVSNDRHSWRNGKFLGGEFFKSDWENGIFDNGEFNYSNFYKGTINGGIIGSLNISIENTKVYNAEINYTNVQNAQLYAIDPNLYGLSGSTINWYNGIFNEGLFGSDISQTASNLATWHDGQFNGGQFVSMAKWKNGTFNNGKFLSGYGWTVSGGLTAGNSTQLDYTWENGVFNNGIFGNETTGTNSTWYNGEFNNGKFVGRIWNTGVFSHGQFIGSSTYSAIGGMSSSNASLFNDSFTHSFYGLWRDGMVTDKKDRFIKDKKFFTNLKRFNYREPLKSAELSNMLWIKGTFSHNSGTVFNSIWLDGAFERGNFNNSSFNPYVRRLGATQSSFNISDDCYWENGRLTNSDFYISKWHYGIFNIGNAYGMIWKNGICNYMNAFNIFWENGIWKNGNWHGSYLTYNGRIDDDFSKQLILRGFTWKSEELIPDVNSCHVWNIFEEAGEMSKIIGSQSADNISDGIDSIDDIVSSE
jgi:transcriptional regulator with XRE-family HTH domain